MGTQLSKDDIEMLQRNTDFNEEEIKENYEKFMKDHPGGRVNKVCDRISAFKQGY